LFGKKVDNADTNHGGISIIPDPDSIPICSPVNFVKKGNKSPISTTVNINNTSSIISPATNNGKIGHHYESAINSPLESHETSENNDGNESSVLFNSPDYFFVSYQIAKKYPDLMESMIIQSFETYMPGELAKRWLPNLERNDNTNDNLMLKIFTTSFLLTLCIQMIAHIPFESHRMIFRVLQPFLLSACAMIAVWLREREEVVVIIIVLIGAALLALVYYYLKLIEYIKKEEKMELKNMFIDNINSSSNRYKVNNDNINKSKENDINQHFDSIDMGNSMDKYLYVTTPTYLNVNNQLASNHHYDDNYAEEKRSNSNSVGNTYINISNIVPKRVTMHGGGAVSTNSSTTSKVASAMNIATSSDADNISSASGGDHSSMSDSLSSSSEENNTADDIASDIVF
jgi:hypothetical protein